MWEQYREWMSYEFQFPSNGKARVNQEWNTNGVEHRETPFQFPSNGKARVNSGEEK